MNWNSDRLSPHTSRRTSQGFNLALQYHASPHPCRLIGPKFRWHRPQLGGSALPALRSLLLPNQLAVSTDILTHYCTLEILTFKLRFSLFFCVYYFSVKTQNHHADRGQTLKNLLL